MRVTLPVLRQAEHELSVQLKHWITTAPDGELRYTAHKYRSALVQIKNSATKLEKKLYGRLLESTEKAQQLAVEHLINDVARFSKMFEGAAQTLPLGVAKEIATARSYIIARARTSAARYAWGAKAGVAKDMQRMLAVDILKGASPYETIQRLIRHGGPRGLVGLRGVAGEKGSIVEHIPEGLFNRYRHWAERIVRTETASAYGYQARESMRRGAEVVEGLKRMWFADARACAQICGPMNGQVVAIEKPFYTPFGDAVQYGGAHPNCGCSQVPWKSDWH